VDGKPYCEKDYMVSTEKVFIFNNCFSSVLVFVFYFCRLAWRNAAFVVTLLLTAFYGPMENHIIPNVLLA